VPELCSSLEIPMVGRRICPAFTKISKDNPHAEGLNEPSLPGAYGARAYCTTAIKTTRL
jgi:hypothetical protein